MISSPILISGASGVTGGIAARLLLAKGFHVRALVHRHDERSQALNALGAEIVQADLLDLRAIRQAFNGVRHAYFVYPMRPGLLEATTVFAQAAAEAKAEFIVNMSQRSAHANARSNSALHHWLAEHVFARFPTPVTHLHPTIFHQWLLYMQKGIAAGRYAVPFGTTGTFASVSAEDIGRVIAALLSDPAHYVGQTLELFGPEELTTLQIAAHLRQVLDRPVEYAQVSGEQWIKDIRGADVEIPYLAQHLNGIAMQQQEGEMAGTNEVIERITGRKPQSVAEFIAQHRAAFA